MFAGLIALGPCILKLWVDRQPTLVEPSPTSGTATSFTGYLERTALATYGSRFRCDNRDRCLFVGWRYIMKERSKHTCKPNNKNQPKITRTAILIWLQSLFSVWRLTFDHCCCSRRPRGPRRFSCGVCYGIGDQRRQTVTNLWILIMMECLWCFDTSWGRWAHAHCESPVIKDSSRASETYK